MGRAFFYPVSNAISYCTNASRSLSAISEFLVFSPGVDLMIEYLRRRKAHKHELREIRELKGESAEERKRDEQKPGEMGRWREIGKDGGGRLKC